MQLVPDTRRIVKTITVEENLRWPRSPPRTPWTLERIYELFPALQARRTSMGRALSGGEQQMLAIGARADPRRAPVAARRTVRRTRAADRARPGRDTRRLAGEGRTIVIVEQNVRAALALAGRAYVLNKGQVVWDGLPAALQAEPELMHRYLGV